MALANKITAKGEVADMHTRKNKQFPFSVKIMFFFMFTL